MKIKFSSKIEKSLDYKGLYYADVHAIIGGRRVLIEPFSQSFSSTMKPAFKSKAAAQKWVDSVKKVLTK